MTDQKIHGNSYISTSGNVLSYICLDTYRPVMRNNGAFKNNWDDFWNGNNTYYTVKSAVPYYGESIL
ncbi:hypothetical protein [uncultured Bacteroides sp.]|uniref:hypothetical protein n=1 Tax=uncultured Bacteroides sp. TaxID=162156 RepID=UPI0025E1305B|nr:hypothetical protein [uncultured Bacteroides sp.]